MYIHMYIHIHIYTHTHKHIYIDYVHCKWTNRQKSQIIIIKNYKLVFILPVFNLTLSKDDLRQYNLCLYDNLFFSYQSCRKTKAQE